MSTKYLYFKEIKPIFKKVNINNPNLKLIQDGKFKIKNLNLKLDDNFNIKNDINTKEVPDLISNLIYDKIQLKDLCS